MLIPGLRLKKLHWTLEKVEDCKLVKQHSESNGHDCWGNFEFTSYNVVFINNKMERVPDGWWVLHNGTEVKRLVPDFLKKDYEVRASAQ